MEMGNHKRRIAQKKRRMGKKEVGKEHHGKEYLQNKPKLSNHMGKGEDNKTIRSERDLWAKIRIRGEVKPGLGEKSREAKEKKNSKGRKIFPAPR